jgi:6-phosphogluconate dehydrogenase
MSNDFKNKAHVGVWGLGVMGKNLAKNLAGRGVPTAVFNRSSHGEENAVSDFMDSNQCLPIRGHDSIDSFVLGIKEPRIIILMITPGFAVDESIKKLCWACFKGDIIIDGGNSHFRDTQRRAQKLAKRGLGFIGMGISGGAKGALLGPCLMPGGDISLWKVSGAILESIAAILPDGSRCAEWMGPGGAGHFVKMVHNGIEYAVMQAIAECYDVMRRYNSMECAGISSIFREWNSGLTKSYLLETAAKALEKTEGGRPIVDLIRDSAMDKGSGRWACVESIELGVPATCVMAALSARSISTNFENRIGLSETFAGIISDEKNKILLSDLRDAFTFASIISFIQGFDILSSGSKSYGWNLPLKAIAKIWQGGSIIQGALIEMIERAIAQSADGIPLISNKIITNELSRCHKGISRAASIMNSVPLPCISAALSYFENRRSAIMPANLIQAMRDSFGRHGFERTDSGNGRIFHLKDGK